MVLCAAEVVEGLDMGTSHMKLGEKAELTLAPAYAYKDQVMRRWGSGHCGSKAQCA